MTNNLSYPITGLTLAKFPDIVQAGLVIKLAQAKTHRQFGFISSQAEERIEKAISQAQKDLPQELCNIEMWGNDFSVLNHTLNHWIAKEANVNIEDISLLDSNTAFSQTIESLVVTNRLQLTRDGNENLIKALKDRANDFKDEIRVTRVHMNEASLGTWGQVFEALADSIAHALNRIDENKTSFTYVLLGSIFGDNVKAPEDYADALVGNLSKLTGHSFVCPSHDNPSSITNLLMGSSRLMELCADLRILSMVYQRFVHGFFIYGSGPRAGLAEIALPAIAPGSTIMPGKINPSMAMLLEQACQHLSAIDQTAQYSYNEYDFDESWQSSGAFLMTAEALELLGKAANLFVEKCLTGFTVQTENNQEHVENALSYTEIVGLLKGKDAQKQVTDLMQTKSLTIKQACLQLGILDSNELESVFDATTLAKNGISLDTLNRYLKKF